MVFSASNPGYEIAAWLGTSMFNFLRPSITYSLVGVPYYIPTNSVQEFPFFTSSAEFIALGFLIQPF